MDSQYMVKRERFFFFCRSDKMARNVFASLIILMGGIKKKKKEEDNTKNATLLCYLLVVRGRCLISSNNSAFLSPVDVERRAGLLRGNSLFLKGFTFFIFLNGGIQPTTGATPYIGCVCVSPWHCWCSL